MKFLWLYGISWGFIHCCTVCCSFPLLEGTFNGIHGFILLSRFRAYDNLSNNLFDHIYCSSKGSVPLWPFLVLSCIGGAYALIPYFVLWRPPPPPIEEQNLKRWPLNVFESKLTAGVRRILSRFYALLAVTPFIHLYIYIYV